MALQQSSQLPNHGETADLVKENERLTYELSQMRLRLLELERDADMDPLIPIFNRRAFMRELARAQAVFARYDIPSSLIFFDLNGFKKINDRFGHSIGDELLRKVGLIILESVRNCDLVARLGGDEFSVLLFQTTHKVAEAKASALACRIAEQKIDHPTGDIRVTAAWGVAPCDPNDTAKQILSRADRAMYINKKSS